MSWITMENEFPEHVYNDGAYTYISTARRDDPDINAAYWQCLRINNSTLSWSWRKNPVSGIRTREFIHTADTNGSGEY